QPPRLLPEAVQPLQAALLDPRGSVAETTRVVVERRPHPDRNAHVQRPGELRHEALLLRSAETAPQDVRTRPLDQAPQLAELGFVQRSEGRRVQAGDLEVG